MKKVALFIVLVAIAFFFLGRHFSVNRYRLLSNGLIKIDTCTGRVWRFENGKYHERETEKEDKEKLTNRFSDLVTQDNNIRTFDMPYFLIYVLTGISIFLLILVIIQHRINLNRPH